MKLTNQQLYQIEEYCWANYATVEGFLENLEWELRGDKVAKIENKIITTTSGNEINFNEII
jgi:hypothetical protein